jgi:hypothetical protein
MKFWEFLKKIHSFILLSVYTFAHYLNAMYRARDAWSIKNFETKTDRE